LVPNLGIVPYRDQKSFAMADIPGIIEGASEGKGLGLRFLRHIERNALLLFLIPADSKDISEEYRILLNELEQYNPELLEKQRVLAISKSDMLDEELMDALKNELPCGIPSVFISSVSGLGIMELKDILWEELSKDENRHVTISHRPMNIASIEDDEDDDELYEEEEFDWEDD
jgi:GTP-binding protein